MRKSGEVRLSALGVADTPGSFLTREVERVELTLGGIEGDRHFGLTARASVRQKHQPKGVELRNSRQLSMVSVEELAEIARKLQVPAVGWQALGANLVLEGRPQLSQLPPSTRLVFPSGATVVVDAENAPCSKPAQQLVQPQFVSAAIGLRGLVGWVERAGMVAVGERATIWEVR